MSIKIVMELSDAEIIRQVQAGNVELFHVIFERHYARIDSFVRRSITDEESCKDLVAEVFVRAYRSVRRFRVEEGISYIAYLYTIARNLVSTTTTAASRIERASAAETLEAEPAADPSPLQEMLRREAIERIRRAISRLPAEHRQILHLAYERDLSSQDIARIMNKPSVSAVTSHLHRALQALRRILEADGYFADLASRSREQHERRGKGG